MARILTLTPNPAVDVTYAVGRQAIGETVRVTDARRRPGGKGLNVARVLRVLGLDVTSLQPLGGEAGAWMDRALRRDGIAVVPCPITQETRTTVAVVDGLSHPTLFAEPGPRLSEEEWDRLCAAMAGAVSADDWIAVAGSFPPGATASIVDRLVSTAHARGARILVDTSGPLLLAAADAGADIVKANEDEVREAVGEPDLDRALSRLGSAGALAMVSRGERGAMLARAGGSRLSRTAVPGISGNPTGAGDAASAGLVAALAAGRSDDEALAWATVCGAAAVLSPVAGEIDTAALPELGARIGLPPEALPLTPADRRSP